MTEKEQFIAWLNDARSTELAMLPVLKNHANDARDYPEIYERKMQHYEETSRQAERLEGLITSLGGSVSTVKTAIGKMLGLGQSISTEIFPDELIKNFLADYAAEHFEIASYQSLIATARIVGEEQCVPVLEEILREEIAMARWLEEHIPLATSESLRMTTEEQYYEYSARNNQSSKRKGRSSYNLSPTLTAILVGSSIGAAATFLARSRNKKGNSNYQLRDSFGDYRNNESASVPESIATESTVIAIDESGSQTAATPKAAADGNS